MKHCAKWVHLPGSANKAIFFLVTLDRQGLEWRAPLLANSNWWLAFHGDSMIPQSALKGRLTITVWSDGIQLAGFIPIC
jgi:hypothetical protein